ncbi:MAG: orotidine-5'-phosphate decarboxylase [Patescibacteria group bacterium]
MQTFTDRLIGAIRKKRSILCVGLDPQLRYMPLHLKQWAVESHGPTMEAVGRLFASAMNSITDATADEAVVVKPQMAFYEGYGQWGMWAFEQVKAHAEERGLLVLEDAKRGDGGDTAEAYADGHLGEVPFWGDSPDKLSTTRSPINCDAMTIQPQIGSACVTHFVERAVKKYGKGIFLVTKTSFSPNSEVEQIQAASGIPVWQEMAKLAGKWGEGTEGESGWSNVGVVMGATYPEDAPRMREILPKAWFLVPGYGAQGGGADGAVVGCTNEGLGCVVNSSRGINYAYAKGDFAAPPEQFAEAARRAAEYARDDLNASLKRA